MKKLWNRDSLKSFFRKGQLPSEVHFGYLIDSTVNKLDDGFTKTDNDGLQLSPTGSGGTVISIFREPGEQHPNWQIQLQKDENGAGISFNSVSENADGSATKVSRLFLANNGNVGVGTTMPRTQLEVNGALGVNTRLGTYKIGQVAGDGEWHDILSALDGVLAFEIVARIDGPPGRGKYAMTHAIALCTFGGSSHRIKQTRAFFGWFWNRIEFRWHGDVHNYSLQMRTRTNYGRTAQDTSFMIRYHITRLWDDSIFTQV